MPPENRNDRQDEVGDAGGLRILVRAPTGDQGALTSIHPRYSDDSDLTIKPLSDRDLESSSVCNSGRRDDSNNPHDDSVSVSPTTSRSESPAGSPARKREEDLAGLASRQGVRFEDDHRNATARNETEEDENDALKVCWPTAPEMSADMRRKS